MVILSQSQLAQFGICLIGACANVLVLIAVARFPRELLGTRINQWAAAITFLCLLWSMTIVVLLVRRLSNIITLTGSAWAGILLTTEVQLIFVLNLSLAAERYFTVHSAGRRQFFAAIFVLWACILAVNLWAYLSSPNTIVLFPADNFQIQVWATAVSIGFLVAALCTSFFYFLTYRTTTRILSQNPDLPSLLTTNGDGISDSTEIELVKLKIEKQLMLQALLSAGVLVLYCPAQTWFIAYAASGGSMDFLTTSYYLLDAFSAVLSLDTVLTPMIILYFKQDVQRRALFWRRER